MTVEPPGAVKVFYSYAHEDKILCDELEKHLGILKRQGQITGWQDRDISAGTEWEREIDTHLNVASIILLLVSPDFIHSEYCYSVEMKRALERHYAGEALVIPVLLRPVDWEDAPFSKLQVLPTDRKPITSWLNRDEAFLDVAQGIRKAVKKINEQQLDEKTPRIRMNDKGALTAYVSKRYREGLEAYERAIHLNPNSFEAYIGKGNALHDLKRYEEALVAFERAIYLNPNHVEAHIGKGNALCNLKRYGEALTAFEQAILMDPNLAVAYNNKGLALERLGKSKEAKQAYKRARQLDYSQ